MPENDPELVPLPLETIHIGFFQLSDRVNAALHTQTGDGVLHLPEAIQQHVGVIPAAERRVTEERIGRLKTLCPLVRHRGPTGLAPVAGVASRTICRRALEYGLVEPAEPVYMETTDVDSGVIRIYISSTTGPVSSLTDDELDQLMHHTLGIFPTFGRRMIWGHLHQLGHHVPTSRIRESYYRVHGPPVSYSNTATGRQPYHVAVGAREGTMGFIELMCGDQNYHATRIR
ncbi:hypothetical protein B0H11DRAFT_1932849 [Mycena galericulata]|nr:hypothetical protein B0H11DRAFT_1932849 [Mycena galericulata]